MDDWSQCTIGDLARLKSGFAFKSSQWRDQGIPVVKIGNVKQGSLDLSGCSYVSVDDARASGFELSQGDILIGLTGYVGQVAKVRDDSRLVLNQRVGKFFPKKGCNPDFLFFLVANDAFRSRVESIAHGSAQPNVSPTSIERLEMIVPLLHEQDSIAEVLAALDDKIELNRRMHETLEAMAQAIFRDWFVDFGPVRRALAGATDPVAIMGGLTPDPARAAHLAALVPAAFGNDGLPVGWKAGTLGDIAKAVGETVDPKSLRPDTPYFGLEHLPRCSITLDDWGQAASVNSNKAKFKAGQVLFGKLRPYFHKVGIAPLDGVCSTDIVVMDGIRPIDRPFVVSCASSKSFVDYTDQGSTGTKMPRTSWGQMKKYPLVISTALVRDAYSEIVQPMHDKIIAAVHENRTLAETRDYLLPRLMSGAVRVTPQAEPA